MLDKLYTRRIHFYCRPFMTCEYLKNNFVKDCNDNGIIDVELEAIEPHFFVTGDFVEWFSVKVEFTTENKFLGIVSSLSKLCCVWEVANSKNKAFDIPSCTLVRVTN